MLNFPILCQSDTPALGYIPATWMSDLGPKWVRLVPNRTIPGIFQIRFTEPKCTVSDLKKKMLGFVPFGANLTHFGPNLMTPPVSFPLRRANGDVYSEKTIPLSHWCIPHIQSSQVFTAHNNTVRRMLHSAWLKTASCSVSKSGDFFPNC